MIKLEEIYKFCFKCGDNNLTYDIPRAISCSNCNLVFYINSCTAVAVIIKNNNDEILLTKRKHNPAKNTWDLPGGFVDIMEKPEKTVVREIKEELNLEVKQMNYLFSFPNKYVYSDYTYFTTDMIFQCEVKSFNNINANDDISGFTFKKIQDIDINSIGLTSIKKVFLKLKNKSN